MNDNINSLKILAYDYSQQIEFADKIKQQEEIIQNQIKEIETTKERMSRRVEQVKEEMRDLYIDTETAYIFSKKTFELLPDAVITIDKDNKLEFINEVASQLFLVKSEKLIGKNIKALLPEIDNKPKGIYLGDIFNIDNQELPEGIETDVYILNEKKKPEKLKVLLIKVSVGLRQQLTAFLKKT